MKRHTLTFVFFVTFVVATVAAQQWELRVTGVNSSLRGVSAASDNVVWASGSGSVVLRSADGGDSWQRLPPPSTDLLDFRDINAINDTTAYVLSIDNGPLSRIYKTTDAGKTWTLQFRNEDPKAFYDAMSFWDADRGMAVSDSVAGRFVILMTEDGGRNWARIPPDKLPAALPNEGAFAASGTNVAMFGTDHVWIATGAASTARVLRSTDRGRTWQIAPTPIIATPASAGIYSIAFRDALHGVVVGGDYSKPRDATDNVAITSDGGATWTLVKERGLSGFRSLVAYMPGSASTFFATGPAGSDISTDDGKTWTPVEGPGFHTFTFAPGKTFGWGAGSAGRVGRIDLGKR
jgi:photosystem II stability/assembly factor-like uncharacterized protein